MPRLSDANLVMAHDITERRKAESQVREQANLINLAHDAIIVRDLGWINTYWALIIPAIPHAFGIFWLRQFFLGIPSDLEDAARIDGASEYRVFRMILPLVRPALGTVAVFNMIPIWNDLWFPLILAPSENVKTVTLGAQVFLGQFVNDWNAVLASLTLSMVPVIILYVIFSRQLVSGLMRGAHR